jgi:hypothetical protein
VCIANLTSELVAGSTSRSSERTQRKGAGTLLKKSSFESEQQRREEKVAVEGKSNCGFG